MSQAYEDLGGTAKPAAPPKAARPRRHSWEFVQHHDKATKHRCTRCGTTRVRIAHTDRFPTCRYTSSKGVIAESPAPPCPW
jgi:hypothetical protein